MTDSHECPGGCGRPVAHHRFACSYCWSRLPADLQTPITQNYGGDRLAHAEAMMDAVRWYREQTLRSAGGGA